MAQGAVGQRGRVSTGPLANQAAAAASACLQEEVLALRKQFLSPGERGRGYRAVRPQLAAPSGLVRSRAHLARPRLRNNCCCHGQAGTAQPSPWSRPAAAMFTHFKKPIMIVDGKMQYLFDEHGRRYLDVSRGSRTGWEGKLTRWMVQFQAGPGVRCT